jgi:hypothetical protein
MAGVVTHQRRDRLAVERLGDEPRCERRAVRRPPAPARGEAVEARLGVLVGPGARRAQRARMIAGARLRQFARAAVGGRGVEVRAHILGVPGERPRQRVARPVFAQGTRERRGRRAHGAAARTTASSRSR